MILKSEQRFGYAGLSIGPDRRLMMTFDWNRKSQLVAASDRNHGKVVFFAPSGRVSGSCQVRGDIQMVRFDPNGSRLAICWLRRPGANLSRATVISVFDRAKNSLTDWYVGAKSENIIGMSWSDQENLLYLVSFSKDKLESQLISLNAPQRVKRHFSFGNDVLCSDLHFNHGELIAHQTVVRRSKSLVRLLPQPFIEVGAARFGIGPAWDQFGMHRVVGTIVHPQHLSRVQSISTYETRDLFLSEWQKGEVNFALLKMAFEEPVAVERLQVSPDGNQVAITGGIRKTESGLLIGSLRQSASFRRRLASSNDLTIVDWLDNNRLIIRQDFSRFLLVHLTKKNETELFSFDTNT